MSVDFANPYLRVYAQGFCALHRRRLEAAGRSLPEWAAASSAAEGELAASEGRPPRPLAATLDIDEIILANIHMHSFQAPAGAQGPDPVDFHAADCYAAPDGRPWPRDDLRLNPLLPGARELMEGLVSRGVAIYLVTGRRETLRAETAENFAYVGLSGDSNGALFRPGQLAGGEGSRLLMQPDLAPGEAPAPSVRPFKEACRRAIEATHRIVVNIGDQASDLGRYGDNQVLCGHPFYFTP